MNQTNILDLRLACMNTRGIREFGGDLETGKVSVNILVHKGEEIQRNGDLIHWRHLYTYWSVCHGWVLLDRMLSANSKQVLGMPI